MRTCLLLLALLCLAPAWAAPEENARSCEEWVSGGDNYKRAHTNQQCLQAAADGVPSAQYSLGMAYEFEGNDELAQKYYRLAANQGGVGAYLALGHSLKESDPWQAIYWYQRYVASRARGYGYAALMISRVFDEMGDEAQSQYWIGVCKASSYKDCYE